MHAAGWNDYSYRNGYSDCISFSGRESIDVGLKRRRLPRCISSYEKESRGSIHLRLLTPVLEERDALRIIWFLKKSPTVQASGFDESAAAQCGAS
jgi:hypothetical protein